MRPIHQGEGLTPGDRIADCSCPRGGGWRPGARWAKEELQARIDALPAHQRPSIQELGRRSEPAANPFRKNPLSHWEMVGVRVYDV